MAGKCPARGPRARPVLPLARGAGAGRGVATRPPPSSEAVARCVSWGTRALRHIQPPCLPDAGLGPTARAMHLSRI